MVKIHAASRRSPDFEDDTCTVTAEMADGTLASGVFCFSTSPNSDLEIFGDRGRLLVSCYAFDGFDFLSTSTYPGGIGKRLRNLVSSLGSVRGALPNALRGGDFAATYFHLWNHFADCIRRGVAPACTLEDGKHAVQVALAALQSVESGRPVSVV